MTGKQLREARKRRGMGQLALMRALGLRSTGCVSDWERGEAPIPGKHIGRIAAALGMDDTPSPARVTAPEVKHDSLRDLRERAWEMGVTISAAHGRYTLTQADCTPTRRIEAWRTLEGVAAHVERLERARRQAA